ncbi:MAG: DNA repair protein RadC [Candidatus Paceibacterota bacterium]
MPKIKDLHKIERPREKLEKYGPGKLEDEELLAILLRTGGKGMNVVELSKKILRTFKKEGIANASMDELLEIKGLGKAKVCEILACFEIGRRFLKNKKTRLIMSPKDVWEACKDFRSSRKEHFAVFFLDTRNQEIKREIISIGTLNASLVHPREVFEPAIRVNAASVILAHNHPSGDCTPSNEDKKITKRLVEAGKLLGIEVRDHVITGTREFSSMKQDNLLKGSCTL